MKDSVRKYAARRICFTIPLLAIVLFVSPAPAKAGLLDTVNNKVTVIKNQVASILSNTNGLGDFVTTLKDMRESMGSEMINDLRAGMDDTRNLIQFLKDRREMAGQSSQYPSLPNLIRSLDDVVDVLAERERQGGALEGLSALLDVLPDRALAPVARVVSRAGVDADFVSRIDQMAFDLAGVNEILNEAETAQDNADQNAEANLTPDDERFLALFECHIHDSARLIRLYKATKSIKLVAGSMKLYGAAIETATSAVETNTGFAVWGWAGKEVETKTGPTIGKSLVIAAESALFQLERAKSVIDPCIEEKKEELKAIGSV